MEDYIHTIASTRTHVTALFVIHRNCKRSFNERADQQNEVSPYNDMNWGHTPPRGQPCMLYAKQEPATKGDLLYVSI